MVPAAPGRTSVRLKPGHYWRLIAAEAELQEQSFHHRPVRCEFYLQHIQYFYGAHSPTGGSPALSSASVSEAEQPWRRAPRVRGQPRTMRPKEKLSNLMGWHDFSAITALILAPAHAAKSSSLNGAVTSLVLCSKVASKHARGRVNACKAAM